MHQTFYIDIDEEITSIVERLRGAKASEVIIVVPKRALLIQSIVNLRLLKRQADNLGISIMIVTQDKLGKLLIEKAGILVQNKLDDMEEDEINDSSSQNGEKISSPYFSEEDGGDIIKERKELPNKIGTDNYFDSLSDRDDYAKKQDNFKKAKEVPKGSKDELEKLINKELVVGINEEIRKKKNYGVDSMRMEANVRTDKPLDVRSIPPQTINTPVCFPYPCANRVPEKASYFSDQDQKIKHFFEQTNQNQKSFPVEKNKLEHQNLSGKFKKMVLVFGVILVTVVVSILFYLVIPSATIYITTKAKAKSADTEVKGDINLAQVDYEKGIIPAKLVSVTDEISKTYPTSGNKAISNQKAHGKITIYNEFSSNSQSLVATTRFLSEDNKLFRLVSGVTVPGMEKNGTEVKPGTVEAEVIADESGDGFNIGASKFTIPGFKDSGSEKYQKFYAKSENPMTGGGSGGSGDVAKALSQTDIDSAKSKLVVDIKAAIKEKLKQSAGEGMIMLDDAVSLDEAIYKISNSPGEVVDDFQISANIKGSAIFFSDGDMKSVVSQAIAKAGDGKADFSGSAIELGYGKADTDFKTGTLIVKVHGNVEIVPNIDQSNLKRGILGKTNDELEAYLSTYSDIEKAEVIYWPPFLSNKVPMYEKRVNIEINLPE